MKSIPFTKEAKELNELAKDRENSYRTFCVKLAGLQERVVDAGIVFKWWARDNLVNPRDGKPWAYGTLHAHIQLGRKTDDEWRQNRARKARTDGKRSLAGLSRRPVNEQVDVLMIAWEQLSEEARRIFLDQVMPRGRRAA